MRREAGADDGVRIRLRLLGQEGARPPPHSRPAATLSPEECRHRPVEVTSRESNRETKHYMHMPVRPQQLATGTGHLALLGARKATRNCFGRPSRPPGLRRGRWPGCWQESSAIWSSSKASCTATRTRGTSLYGRARPTRHARRCRRPPRCLLPPTPAADPAAAVDVDGDAGAGAVPGAGNGAGWALMPVDPSAHSCPQQPGCAARASRPWAVQGGGAGGAARVRPAVEVDRVG